MLIKLLAWWAGLKLGARISNAITTGPRKRIAEEKKKKNALRKLDREIQAKLEPYFAERDPKAWTKSEIRAMASYLGVKVDL